MLVVVIRSIWRGSGGGGNEANASLILNDGNDVAQGMSLLQGIEVTEGERRPSAAEHRMRDSFGESRMRGSSVSVTVGSQFGVIFNIM